MSALVSRAHGLVCMPISPSPPVDASSNDNRDRTHKLESSATSWQVKPTVCLVSSIQSNVAGDVAEHGTLPHKEVLATAGCTDVTTTYESCTTDNKPFKNVDNNDLNSVFKQPTSKRLVGSPTATVGVDGPCIDDKDYRTTAIRRISSSSIPHLMSSSKVLTVEGQQLIHRQLQPSLIENEAMSFPFICSRDNSFVFSVDGDDSGFGSLHPERNAKQPASSSLGSNYSSSTLSLISVNVHHFGSPPCNTVPFQVLELTQEQQQLNALITRQQNFSNAEHDDVASLNIGQAQPNRSCSEHSTIPILYSAINSLERYNAGSFDNKVLLAKARGMHGRQKAFPGVPRKGNDSSSSTESFSADGLDYKKINSTSKVATSTSWRQRSICSTPDEMMRNQQQDACVESFEGTNIVAVTSMQSISKVHKSKSSGHLVESDDEKVPEKVEELKAFQKSKKGNRTVVINDQPSNLGAGKRRDKRVGVFRPSSDAYTPRMENRDIKYKPAEERESVEKISSTMGTIQRPNFRDALRRVAIILHQHIIKIESRFSMGAHGVDDTGLFKASMRDQFNEDKFLTPRYKCSMVRVPMARPGVVYSMRKIRVVHTTPTTDEIYEFAHQLFKKVQLSSECSIVCLIYVEKLMEVSKVPLVSETWRPIFMCGLLLASKVWQDLSSWNIEFASVYPQFSLHAINRLELLFLKFIKWDLYISSSLYAKYYFALRALLEKSGFRGRYNQMVGGPGGIAASEALKVSKRSEAVKEEVLQQLSRSM